MFKLPYDNAHDMGLGECPLFKHKISSINPFLTINNGQTVLLNGFLVLIANVFPG